MFLFGTFRVVIIKHGAGCIRRMKANQIFDLGTEDKLMGQEMKTEQTRELYQYWSDLNAIYGIPERHRIEPSPIAGILGDTFILELGEFGENRYRLAGTRLCAAFCQELKGQSFFLSWEKQDRKTIAGIVDAVCQDQVAALIGSSARSGDNRMISLETLLLPLLHDGAKQRRLLGLTTSHTRPVWLGSDPILSLSMSSWRIIDPAGRAESFNSSFNKKFDAEKPPIVPASDPLTGRRVKHLTVMDGGKMDGSIDTADLTG